VTTTERKRDLTRQIGVKGGRTARQPKRPTLEIPAWEAETDGPFKGHNTAGGKGLKFERRFTTEGVHPYDQVKWAKRDIEMRNWRDDTVNFAQAGVEFPTSDYGWSANAVNIVASKYFRGQPGKPDREYSLKQLIDRVVGMYVKSGKANGYFATDADAEIFEHELIWMLLHQYFSFNSPVWFNVGWEGRKQQVSACFILSVDDTMESILDWYRQEGLIFKGGSGAGLNLSRIRSSRELLSAGGQPSGPTSFMRGADSSAGTIASGGATRRAAKMVILDVDHPDIEEFVELKAREERKIRVLRDAGFDMDISGRDSHSVQYQNANNSVRVTDEFMAAVEARAPFQLKARTTDQTWEVDAKGLFDKLAQAAWESADPGIQYDDTINRWHTCPETGRINASNPCSEYMHLDNSSCNLASFNLMKFRRADGTFDAAAFEYGVELAITAMDISICFADFPTPAIADTTHKYRQLGLGYANLGALLMSTGRGYDSEDGQATAALITSLMQGVAARRSAELASVAGPYQGYKRNMTDHLRVIRQHTDAHAAIRPIGRDDRVLHEWAARVWGEASELGHKYGYRNAQYSVLAPTGTIGFMMDCDTTGVEPDFALAKYKKLVGGGSMEIVNQSVQLALEYLGYAPEARKAIEAFIVDHGHVVGAPGLAAEHYEVFDCAVGDQRAISPMGHVRMMAAVQPFISGAISKTVNMPESATIEEVEEIYLQGWKLGLKALAIYRDKCKVGQPLSNAKAIAEKVAAEVATLVVDEAGNHLKVVSKRDDGTVVVSHQPVRKRLNKRRTSQTTSFKVGESEGYLTVGQYPDGAPGEIFIKLGKQGSTLAGVMDAFSLSISVGLQYGIPLEFYVAKYLGSSFEPAGMTDDQDLRIVKSLIDYLFRRLALDYLSFDKRSQLGIYTAQERARQIETGAYQADEDENVVFQPADEPVVVPKVQREAAAALPGVSLTGRMAQDAPLCMSCGTKMRPAGSCYACESCGSTSGCS
jgi:ribonucleoside-diphosphate reductase alpha chain